MDINKVIEILNKNKHRGRVDWEHYKNNHTGKELVESLGGKLRLGVTYVLDLFEATAIAEKYERDELMKTYNLGVIILTHSPFEGLYNYNIIYPNKKE